MTTEKEVAGPLSWDANNEMLNNVMPETGPMTMEANSRVGQYMLERPLGEGGMAEVWLARNVHLGTPAAIKFLNRSYCGVAEIEQRFLNEGKRQGALNHPNIIKVYGFEYVQGRSFLILQYIEGESLDDLLRRCRLLSPAEAVPIAIGTLNALDYAHEHSIVHRDIKPSNILLDSNRFPYLGDFGIVLATNEKRITRTGTAMGTALYMSPEQIREPSSVDRRSDIYSFGCVLFEMLTGDPPFNPPSTGQGDTDFAVKLAHVQQQPPSLRSKNPALPQELEAVVMRCLSKNPAERYATCRELRDALSAAADGRPSPPPTPPRQATMMEAPGPLPPPGPVYSTPVPQPQPLRPGEQFCPQCRTVNMPGAMTCRACNVPLGYMPGPMFANPAMPGVVPPDLASKANQARMFGISGLATMGLSILYSASQQTNGYMSSDAQSLSGTIFLIGMVFSIIAVVKGKRSRSLLAAYPQDPVTTGRAGLAVKLGWIGISIAAVLFIIAALR